MSINTKLMKIFVCLTFLTLSYFAVRASVSDKEINGYYLTADQKAQVYIFKATNGMFYGRIVWLSDEMHGQKDVKNPNEQLRGREIKGVFIVSELKYDGDQWSDGRIYDPWTGNSYDCYAYFEGEKNKLFLRVYKGSRLIGKTLEWHAESKIRQ